MRKMIFVMVGMLFLLTACVSSDTSGEKENTKAEDVEDSNSDSMKITLDTASDFVEEKNDKNTTDTDGKSAEEKNNKNTSNSATGNVNKTTNVAVDKSVVDSIKKEAATSSNETLKDKYLKKINDTKVKVDHIKIVDSTTPL